MTEVTIAFDLARASAKYKIYLVRVIDLSERC